MPAKLSRSFSSIQTGTTSQSVSGTATVTFAVAFKYAPVVIVTEVDTTATANHKLYITAISKTSFTVAASNPEDGGVIHWQAIG